jgi:hypothetical protein
MMTSGPVPMKVYQVLLAAAPVPSSPICLNQLPSHLSRLVDSHCQVIKVMIGHVVNLPLTCLPSTRGDGSWRISSTFKCFAKQSSTMSVKALWLLWLEKGANDAEGKGSNHTAKHKKAQRQDTATSSVVIPLELMECLNKMEQKQIKFLLGNKKPALYYAWWEEYYENPKKAIKLHPPRMLDSECVKYCGLKTMYFVTCNSDASVYSLTNLPEWLHGGWRVYPTVEEMW